MLQIMAYLKSFNIFRETKNKIEEEAKMGKGLLTSKTFWFNVLSGAVGVATTLGQSAVASNPKVQAGFAAFVGIGNIILRFLTDQPIEGLTTPK